jgi:probable phosphoglycerate mutase
MSGDTVPRRVALDGASRRRIYLFRHGSVDYMDDHGNVVADTDIVDLNPTGRSQAEAMRELFRDVDIDRAVCSGLPRTQQTGEIVLGERSIALEVDPGFAEIQQLRGEVSAPYDVVADIAFSHWRAPEDEARFLGGERYSDFYQRIQKAACDVLSDPSWHNMAIFAHGGTNAAFLGWVTGLELAAFGVFDQATCCLNVVDFDTDADGRVLRKTVRAMNITADDPAKGNRHSGDMESLARWMLRRQENGGNA